jgi:hypothetical protein
MSDEKQRTMKISRALTRLKTIDAQLANISSDIMSYGAGSNKTILRLSNAKNIADNHAEVAKEMKAHFQQFKDLVAEKIKIKLAIDAANAVTEIEVGGKRMTIAEALVIQNRIMSDYQTVVNAFNHSVQKAQMTVAHYNTQFSKIEDSVAKVALLADVAYFVKAEDFKELSDFITVFKAELNGTLNEVNAVTDITIND